MAPQNDDTLLIVRCSECNREVTEQEAQAQRWGYWSDGVTLRLLVAEVAPTGLGAIRCREVL